MDPVARRGGESLTWDLEGLDSLPTSPGLAAASGSRFVTNTTSTRSLEEGHKEREWQGPGGPPAKSLSF